ncbi:MAG: hypothetical protein COZ09_12220, partial [Comamonadaceae bacterium CG_4_10_14_3_um_filter_60_42]
ALRQWQSNRHHCLSVIDGLCVQSVGKAAYRHAKALGVASLTHRAGIALASSVQFTLKNASCAGHRRGVFQ